MPTWGRVPRPPQPRAKPELYAQGGRIPPETVTEISGFSYNIVSFPLILGSGAVGTGQAGGSGAGGAGQPSGSGAGGTGQPGGTGDGRSTSDSDTDSSDDNAGSLFDQIWRKYAFRYLLSKSKELGDARVVFGFKMDLPVDPDSFRRVIDIVNPTLGVSDDAEDTGCDADGESACDFDAQDLQGAVDKNSKPPPARDMSYFGCPGEVCLRCPFF